MTDPKRLNTQELVSYLAENAGHWIESQRAQHRVHADPLPDTTLAALSGFFEKGTLDRTRIRHVPSIENPPFYKEFEEAGEAFPLDFTVWAAITFGDVILVNGEQVPGPPSHSVVFHEMVHVVQYDELGIHEFARRYVTPFVQSRFNYMSIPLESVAFDLQGRFEERSGDPFSAEEEIRSRISAPGLPYAGSGRRP
ncbi:MAG TPA: hypothetical protein DCS76_05605 [Gemmatimonadetes bacterium]|nr:hypothetical protein [Gemmatimonadota bacterium]HAT17247.1 hypothetical protein [Gemmatimonadota bacterium]